jgi:hypothetical protein
VIELSGYKSYRVTVEADGYRDGDFAALPIYPGITQNLTFYLKAIYYNEYNGSVQVTVLDLFTDELIPDAKIWIGSCQPCIQESSNGVTVTLQAHWAWIRYGLTIAADGYRSSSINVHMFPGATQNLTVYLSPTEVLGKLQVRVLDSITGHKVDYPFMVLNDPLIYGFVDDIVPLEVPPGKKVLKVGAPRYSPYIVETTLVIYPSRTTTVDIYLTPDPPTDGTISGTVSDMTTGDAIPNATVTAYSGYPTYINAVASTDLSGTYTLSLRQGLYAVNVKADDYTVYETTVTVQPDTMSVVDVRLKPTNLPLFKSPPSYEVTSIPSDMTFDLGQNVTMTFGVRNVGETIGLADFHLAVPGIYDGIQSIWIEPNIEREITFAFTLPDDLEEKHYRVLYEVGETGGELTFFLHGAKISIDASMDRPLYSKGDSAILRLTVNNERNFDLNLFSRVRFNGYESVTHFDLTGLESKTLFFDIPVEFTGRKIFFSVYMASGRSLYLSSMQIYEKPSEASGIELYTDKSLYYVGDQVTIFVDASKTETLTVTAPGFIRNVLITGPMVLTFTLPNLRSGTYFIEYTFGALQRTHPIDVIGYSAKILEATLDSQEAYRIGDPFKLSLNAEMTKDSMGIFRIQMYDPQGNLIDSSETPHSWMAGENRITVSRITSTSAYGIHRLVYEIRASLDANMSILLALGTIYFDILPSNEPPRANAGGNQTVPEGAFFHLDASSSSDPDGDVLQYRWDIDNDGIWDTDWSDSPYAEYLFDDDYSGEIVLEVSDGELTDTDMATLSVDNVSPSGDIDGIYLPVEATVRVSGTKDNIVTLVIEQEGLVAGSVEVKRTTGAPNEATLYTNIDLTKSYTTTIYYDSSTNGYGANPVWIIIDGKKTKITTFVTAPKDSSTFHQSIDVNLGNLLTTSGKELIFKASATDPGSDDLYFTWDFGDGGSETHVYYNDGMNPDPSQSPGGIYPYFVDNTAYHIFTAASTYTVTLTVKDDDGGVTTVTKVIALT